MENYEKMQWWVWVLVELGPIILRLAGGEGIGSAAARQQQQHDKFVLVVRTLATTADLASAGTAAATSSAPALLQHLHQTLQSPQKAGTPISQATTRPRVRVRRGQATDPRSIAERLRRERIAERMKALQELVPVCNKIDRVTMLVEIVDYLKFLGLQVEVFSMGRLGGTGAVAQLVAGVRNHSAEGESVDDGRNMPAWEKWTADGTEQEVAKLMEEDSGAVMQFLQSKALCIMPLSLASAIFRP